ncbi:MAG: hypothetical protein ACREE2_00970 [Stellaceae bacterium]
MRAFPFNAALAATLALAPMTAWAASSVVGETTGASAAPLYTCPGTDTPPAIAAAWGLTCEVFVDNMENPQTYDIGDTRRPGFHWYDHNNMPDAAQTDCPTEKAAPYCWPPLVAQPEDYTINSSGLTINSTTSGNNYPWWMWNTCYWNGTAVAGTMFQAPFYIDVSYSYSGSIISPMDYSGWSIAWMLDENWFGGGQGSPVRTTEIDLYESPYGRTLHDYTYDAGAIDGPDNAYYLPAVGGSPNGTLVIPPAMNGGIGLVERATSDVAYDTLEYSPTMVPVADGTATDLPSGTYSIMPNEHYCLMVSNGTGQTTNISRIAVWTLPPSRS